MSQIDSSEAPGASRSAEAIDTSLAARRPVVFEINRDQAACLEAAGSAHFYHSFDLSNGLHLAGDWDISRDIASYRFPDVRGKRVLDIGPGSGWFSFYLASLGADVTVVETRGYGDFDVYGESQYTGAGGRPAERTVDGKPIWLGPVSESFWAMHDLLGSEVKYVNGRIYEVSPSLFPEPFDLVLVCALLPHLRDPVGALRAARSVCAPDGLCVATVWTWAEHDDSPHPFQALPHTSIDRISWWLPNKAAYRHWFLGAGFSNVDVEDTLPMSPDRDSGGYGFDGPEWPGTAYLPPSSSSFRNGGRPALPAFIRAISSRYWLK
jgi:SAM-dependent methyltransferase